VRAYEERKLGNWERAYKTRRSVDLTATSTSQYAPDAGKGAKVPTPVSTSAQPVHRQQ